MPDPCAVVDGVSAQQAIGQPVGKAEDQVVPTISRIKVWVCKWVGLATGRSIEIDLWGPPRSVTDYKGALARSHTPDSDLIPTIGYASVPGVPGQVVTSADSAEFLVGQILVKINVTYAHDTVDYGHHVSQTLAPAAAAYLARWSMA